MKTETEKSIILIRGLPGSGKTTLARILSDNGKYPVFSVDSYFTDPESGDYRFNYRENYLAYKQCEDSARAALNRGEQKVFIDNTLTLEWEIEPYMKMASEFGYRIFIVTVENRHGGKNVHEITDEQLQKMAAKYRVVLIPGNVRDNRFR